MTKPPEAPEPLNRLRPQRRIQLWNEAADVVMQGLKKVIASKRVTYDLAQRLMEGATEVSCSAFGQAIVAGTD